MEEYITYDEYKELGGLLKESAFSSILRRTQRKLDYYTHNRLHDKENIIQEVKEVLVIMIDKLYKEDNGEKVTSFSNGKVSYSFATEKSIDEQIEQLIVEYLPVWLISGVTPCE